MRRFFHVARVALLCVIVGAVLASAASAAVSTQNSRTCRTGDVGCTWNAMPKMASESSSYTGWATIDTTHCGSYGGFNPNAKGDPFCIPGSGSGSSTGCYDCSKPIVAVYAYNSYRGTWVRFAPGAQVHVYASSSSSTYAWIWTPSTGFLVAKKSLVRVGTTWTSVCVNCPA